ncbi:acyl carrier protein [Geminocystis sp. GBBB08]|uniref:acyl carrier protein n=1 Tax=Geminocystis sp. GBBB08 TaxID=2604140 RepID=UPI0027E24A36|nr:acyl carrier protein [Geminocystis sp. GBBB08]MBL1209288.1 acyl carrier protein [Geminocystis sp. GBBB08]
MNQLSIKETVKNYIQQEFLYDKPELELNDDSLLIEEEIIDSLGIFVLISFLDEQFQVKVEPQEVIAENFATLDVITSFVENKLA